MRVNDREVNRRWVLARRPVGLVRAGDLELQRLEFDPPSLLDGQILVRNKCFMCAPTIRNWMDPPGNSLYPSIALGDAVMGPTSAEVVASANSKFQPGDRIGCLSSWQDYDVFNPSEQQAWKLPDFCNYVDALGVYGMNALAGYFGLLEVGQLKNEDVVLVSGAAGSAGSIAAQVGKIKGCRVIGIAGSEEKCRWLVDECGLDDCINYKTDNVSDRVGQLCPNGIDVFFDSVGGDVLQVAVDNMDAHGRIVLCGQIANYNGQVSPEGPRNMMRLVYGGIRMQGFLSGHFFDRFSEAIDELHSWVEQGRLIHREDVRGGIECIESEFNALFSGSNKGTLIVSEDVR